MASWKKRVPIVRQSVARREIFEIEFRLELRTVASAWESATFLLDTGSQFTTVAIAAAERLCIPFAATRPVRIEGTTGSAPGFLSPLWFSFFDLPNLQFESSCCFSTARMERSLLSLTDLLRHFTLRTLLPSHLHPLGSVLVQLRADHQGVPRR